MPICIGDSATIFHLL